MLVVVWIRVKGLPSSLFSARCQFAQFLFLAVFCDLIDLRKILNLYMSWRKLRDLSVAIKNTLIGFKIREKLRVESDRFSVS